MPVRGKRRLYLIGDIEVNLDDNPDAIDTAPDQTVNGTTRPIIAKIKEPIGDYFGLTPLDYDNPIFTGIFEGEGLNRGSSFRRRLGGFRDASYTLIAEDNFQISERVDDGSGAITIVESLFKSVSIGLPKGHSVVEVLDWIGSFDNFDNIRALRTPKGHEIDLYKGAGIIPNL